MKFKTITKASDLQVNHVYRNNGEAFYGIDTGDVFRITRLDSDGDPWFSRGRDLDREVEWFSRHRKIEVEHLGEWAHGKSLNKGDKVVVLKERMNSTNVSVGEVLTHMGSPLGKYRASNLNSLGNPWEWWLDSDGLALLAEDAEDETKTTDKPVIYPAIVNEHWAILNRETGKGWKASYPVGGKPAYGEPRTMEVHLADAKRHLDRRLAGNHDSLNNNYTLDRDDVVVELTQVNTPKRDLDRYTFSDGGDSLTIRRRGIGDKGVYVKVNDGSTVIVTKDQVVDLASALLRVAGLTPSEVTLNDDAE